MSLNLRVWFDDIQKSIQVRIFSKKIDMKCVIDILTQKSFFTFLNFEKFKVQYKQVFLIEAPKKEIS